MANHNLSELRCSLPLSKVVVLVLVVFVFTLLINRLVKNNPFLYLKSINLKHRSFATLKKIVKLKMCLIDDNSILIQKTFSKCNSNREN